MAIVTGTTSAAQPSASWALGNAIRKLRHKNRLTIGEIAAQAGLSTGMLSKIENGQVTMSLETLDRVAGALGSPVSDLLREYAVPVGDAQMVRSGEGMEVVRRGTKQGHRYNLLAYDKGPRRRFEPFLVTLYDDIEVVSSFEHEGTEFIHVLSGRIEYRHGQDTYVLGPGDSLTFRGDVVHGPEHLLEAPVTMLSIIVYGDADPR